MSLLEYLVAVIPMLGILIFVHELGHFLVAKACGVRVLKFSLGFGSPVGFGRYRMRWERAGTEYVVAWFPLGGFVKMLGENLAIQGQDDPDAVADARPDEYLNAKPTWQKLSIVFAGPAMNLALPVLAFVGVLAVGIPRPAPVVGSVEDASPAALAGLRPGDRVVEVDAEPVIWWEDLESAVRGRTEGELALRIERDGSEQELAVPVDAREGLDEFGVSVLNGWIGVEHWRLPPLVGVTEHEAPAHLAGLRSGDRVVSLGGDEIEDWNGFRAAYLAQTSATVEIGVERLKPREASYEDGAPEPSAEEEVPLFHFTLPALGSLEALGVVPATVMVEAVDEEAPAGRAGLAAGDLILTVDGRPVGSFAAFQETVRASKGRSLELSYSRDGGVFNAVLTPELKSVDSGLGIEETVYLIGIRHRPTLLPGVSDTERERNPLVALPRAVGMTVEKTGQFLRGLAKIATGEIGRDKLAGPIGIAEIARKSLDLGWKYYLYTMIFISINLGILNLMPIPILDGGQALIFAVEGVKGGPISMRTREIVQQVGLTMILMLMGLAFWNDISRNWSGFVAWLTGTG